MPDIFGLIAHRKLIIQNGVKDASFPAVVARGEYERRIKPIYDLVGGELVFQEHDVGHRPRVDLLDY